MPNDVAPEFKMQPSLTAVDQKTGEPVFVAVYEERGAAAQESVGGTKISLPTSIPIKTIICAKAGEGRLQFWQVIRKNQDRAIIEEIDPQNPPFWLKALAEDELVREGVQIPPYSPESETEQKWEAHFRTIGSRSPNIKLAVITPGEQERHEKELARSVTR